MEKLISFLVILKGATIFVGKWVQNHSAFVNAAATLFIAAFTLALVCATRKLWKVSQEQSRDMKTSLAIARDAADAAEKSANALPAIERAYLFVRVYPENESEKFVIGDNPGKLLITNYGKTPAILIEITAISGYFIAPPALCHGIIFDILPDTIIEGRPGVCDKMEFPIKFTIQNEDQLEDVIHDAPLGVFIHGCIKYKDIFGELRETRFYWEYSYARHAFFPVEDNERNYRT